MGSKTTGGSGGTTPWMPKIKGYILIYLIKGKCKKIFFRD